MLSKTVIKNELSELGKYSTHVGKYFLEKSKNLTNPFTQITTLALAFNLALYGFIININNTVEYDLHNLEQKSMVFNVGDIFPYEAFTSYNTEPQLEGFIPLDEAPTFDYASATVEIPEAREAATFENDATSKIQWPFPYGVPISSGYGPRTPSCNYCSSYHRGLDFTPGLGAGIQAVADGVVYETKNFDRTYLDTPEASYGTYIIINHNVDGVEFQSLYAHLMFGSIAVKAGDKVKVGDFLGQVGVTGITTGPHLHFEIRIDGQQINPYPWLTEMNKKTSKFSE